MGALDASKVGLQYGGEQPIMRDSKITEGCLGKYSPKLEIGDIQHMVFQSTDSGLFYLSSEEREECCSQ